MGSTQCVVTSQNQQEIVIKRQSTFPISLPKKINQTSSPILIRSQQEEVLKEEIEQNYSRQLLVLRSTDDPSIVPMTSALLNVPSSPMLKGILKKSQNLCHSERKMRKYSLESQTSSQKSVRFARQRIVSDSRSGYFRLQ